MSGDRDYIGFATLPEQVHRKSVKRGFEFTLMVLGETGLGKSTLINSLFLGDLYKDRRIPDVSERIEKTTSIEKKTMDIEERGVRLRLTIVDTPGFGDSVNCEDTWKACSSYIDEQFRQYFTDESGLNRKNIQDNRVHCCLYFIPPYGHGLRQLDLEVLRRLHRKVNVVPVIAKADTLTTQEVKKLKERILADIEEHEIQGLFGSLFMTMRSLIMNQLERKFFLDIKYGRCRMNAIECFLCQFHKSVASAIRRLEGKTFCAMSVTYASRFEAVFLCTNPKGPKMTFSAAVRYMRNSKDFVRKWVKRDKDVENEDLTDRERCV
ncbi:septin-2-like [Belonocnema kinseyi]|uniref:septin-2-like n=1 Tax=Belonocnema kinseyi TaxID=2817044 RepID=UPI00143D47E4|nr:septin-2-like [Belonocnema kinseyi]